MLGEKDIAAGKCPPDADSAGDDSNPGGDGYGADASPVGASCAEIVQTGVTPTSGRRHNLERIVRNNRGVCVDLVRSEIEQVVKVSDHPRAER